jgi:crossover junction endodeoxyribonuclease RusA
MTAIEFTVAGQPVPQGSSRAFRAGDHARLVSTTPRLSAWRADIAAEARAAMARRQVIAQGPIAIRLEFRPRPRPESHFLPANSRRPVRILRPDAPVWNDGTPDADKLARAALDALSGVVWRDDRQVASLTALTLWPDDGETTGVDVRIHQLEATR